MTRFQIAVFLARLSSVSGRSGPRTDRSDRVKIGQGGVRVCPAVGSLRAQLEAATFIAASWQMPVPRQGNPDTSRHWRSAAARDRLVPTAGGRIAESAPAGAKGRRVGVFQPVT
jgi:hypothetical protein